MAFSVLNSGFRVWGFRVEGVSGCRVTGAQGHETALERRMSRVTVVIAQIKGLTAPIVTAHEPPTLNPKP